MKRMMLGLAIGVLAMAFTQMTPAHAGTSTKSYVAGGAAGLGFSSGEVANGIGLGGVQFEGVSGTKITITVNDAVSSAIGGVAANVSFRKAQDPSDPTGPLTQISSTRLCGNKLTNFPIPGGTTVVVVFMYAAYPETPATTGFGCTAGKVGPATTGTVRADWS